MTCVCGVCGACVWCTHVRVVVYMYVVLYCIYMCLYVAGQAYMCVQSMKFFFLEKNYLYLSLQCVNTHRERRTRIPPHTHPPPHSTTTVYLSYMNRTP